jgi:hypothetical protein
MFVNKNHDFKINEAHVSVFSYFCNIGDIIVRPFKGLKCNKAATLLVFFELFAEELYS